MSCVNFITAQQASVDSVRLEPYSLRAHQLILPATLIAVGAFGVENGWACSVKNDVRDGFQDLRSDCRFRVDDYLQYLPVAAHVGIGLIGKNSHPLRERIAVTATAYAAMGLMVNVTKYAVKEKRPDSGAKNSFPSGHTATAFMGAELVRKEYGNAYGVGAYAFATGIAFLRLYNDRHWLNDIIAGAGVGILSAHIGYWLLPLEQQLFGWGDSRLQCVVAPVCNPIDRNLGLVITASF
ncbi:MAG: phosphatase PAP2 family protein [Prevotella sp.]|nr:phosphatase PAP2 family protein [Prevotella sp.]